MVIRAEPIARLVAQPFERRIDLPISSSLISAVGSDVSTTTMRKIGFSLETVVVRCGMTVDTLSFLAWKGGTGEWGGLERPLGVGDQFLPEAEAGVVALVANAIRCRFRALHDAVIGDEVDELGGVAFQK
jgi:hypothetical protein